MTAMTMSFTREDRYYPYVAMADRRCWASQNTQAEYEAQCQQPPSTALGLCKEHHRELCGG